MRIEGIALIVATALVISCSPSHAEITEGGLGLAYGKGNAYFLTAPPGWMLDTESGASQHVYAVFYPKGSSWDDGPAVMYSNAQTLDGRSLQKAFEKDFKDLQTKSPDLKATDGGFLETKDKKQALLKYYTGDRYGNYEAVAYVPEKTVVANIVLTARTKAEYDRALPSFKLLVGSYKFLTEEPDKLDLKSAVKEEHDKNLLLKSP
jgi:hypothetical protein